MKSLNKKKWATYNETLVWNGATKNSAMLQVSGTGNSNCAAVGGAYHNWGEKAAGKLISYKSLKLIINIF